MERYPGVDMVVVNYRTPQHLWDFLRSYHDHRPDVPHSLHVVNVCPQEGDTEVVNDWATKYRFLYTKYDENVGYAKACNDAGSLADREVLAFFNADTRLARGVVEECHTALAEHDDWGVVGPRQVDSRGRITHAGIWGTRESPSFAGRWLVADRGQFSEVRDDCVSVSGSAYFVRGTTWDELYDCPMYRECPDVDILQPSGPFLPTPHFYEETYLSYHAIEHGWKIGYLGTSVMNHEWHASSPVGSISVIPAKALFVAACEYHGIPHD